MTSVRGIAVLVGILVALSVVPLPAAQARTAAGDYAAEAVSATNVQRVANDRRRLRVNHCLKRMATKAARRMAEQQQMGHQSLDAIQDRCEMNWVGENVAYHYTSGTAVVDAWMQSPDHRANLLNRHFRLVGIGARMGADGNWYVSQVLGSRS